MAGGRGQVDACVGGHGVNLGRSAFFQQKPKGSRSHRQLGRVETAVTELDLG